MKSFWFLFLEKSRVTFLLVLGLILMGGFALTGLNIESNPEINQPLGIVQTFYRNASAIDVERNVTEVLEEAFEGLDDVKEITSSSSNNFSSITVEFESNADPDDVILDLREAVNKVSGQLPEDADDPEVIELDFNGQSIVSLSLVGTDDFKELTEIAEDVADDIKSISGVSRVDVIGGFDDEVAVIVDSFVAEFYGISTGEILQTISSGNTNAPIGEIRKSGQKISTRLKGEITDLETLRNLPLRDLGGESNDLQLLTLSDVAEVRMVAKNQDSLSFVGVDDGSKRAVTLNVFKSNGGNIVSIVDAVDAKVAEIAAGNTEIEIIKTNDNAFFIRDDLSTLSSSGLQTVAVIFLAILLILTFKEALVASVAIPLIFLITFIVLFTSGETLNGLTIFSLILSLGLVVDTSIVIVEGIYEYKREGYDSKTAAQKTLTEYKWPLVAGTLTTLSAFAPMLLVGGIVGAYIRTIPIVLSITLAGSLLVSFAITPLLSAKVIDGSERIRRKIKGHEERGISRKEQFFDRTKDRYEGVLGRILKSTLARIGILVVAGIAFVASMSLPVTGVLTAQLFPEDDVPFIYINVEAPLGTKLEETRELSKVVEEALRGKEFIKNYTLNVGNKVSTDNGPGGSSQDNFASFIVNLIDDKSMREDSFVIANNLRKDLEGIDTVLDIKVESIAAGPPVAAPLEIKVTGSDLVELERLANEIKSVLGNVEGLINISTSFDNQSSEIEFIVDEERIKFYGLDKNTIATSLAALTTGLKASEIRIEGETNDVRIWLDNTEDKDLDQLLNVLLPSQRGFVPFSEIGKFEENKSLQSIPRIDLERSVRVRAFTEDGVLINTLLPEIEEIIGAIELQNGYNVSLGGEDEDIQESFRDLFSSMFVAVILILVILVMQFNSFRQTLIILCTLPLAVIGIFPGLAAMGLPLSFPAFLGIVMLTGIVVNDAIVMVDQINKNIAAGMPVTDAVVKACRMRFIPIILTTITTIFGILPISLGDQFWRGLGFSVIFGLLTATFLTLVIIPILFTFAYRDKKVAEDTKEV